MVILLLKDKNRYLEDYPSQQNVEDKGIRFQVKKIWFFEL